MKIFCLLFCVLVSGIGVAKESPHPLVTKCENQLKKLSQVSDHNKRLHQALDFFWNQTIEESPEYATYLGVSGYDHLWSDRTYKTIKKRNQLPFCQEKMFRTIDSKKLSEANRLTHKLILKGVRKSVNARQFPSELLVVDQLGGIHQEVFDIMVAAPKSTIQDYENRIARLENFPAYMDQTISLMEEGLKQKVTPVKFLMEKVPAQIAAVIVKDPKESPIYKVFSDMPAAFDVEQKKSLVARAEKVLTEKIHPSLEKLKTFIVEKYLPNCRTDISVLSLPNGAKWYEFLAQYHTTTNLTAKEIHETGIAEVARINQEMANTREKLKFSGSKADFHKFLQKDSQFYFKNPKDLISAYQMISKQIDPELPRLFSRLPQLPYGVREMPIYKAKSAPTAYYQPGSLKAGRAGYFEANTYNLSSRPKWEMEVLTVHEAVPGHHFQIAMAQELGELPEFRKHEMYTAFVEGWGLYSESLGDELGLYKDLYSKYGQHVFEMWRAVRLVVDTGMHSMSWTKQKALDYFMENIPKDLLQSENEIDRYITWPGQALAYKIGEMKFKELKKRASDTLQAKFDVREFHDEVLRHGAIPMDVLEEEFNTWLTRKSDLLKKETGVSL